MVVVERPSPFSSSHTNPLPDSWNEDFTNLTGSCRLSLRDRVKVQTAPISQLPHAEPLVKGKRRLLQKPDSVVLGLRESFWRTPTMPN